MRNYPYEVIAMTKPFGFVYETTNSLNNKKYIGKCIYGRKNNWETYLGSGLYLKRTIKKYGAENFIRTILDEADSAEELNELEERYILERNAVESADYYNIKHTSIGGDIFTNNPNKETIRLHRVRQMSGKGNHQHGKLKTARMLESVKKANSKAVIIDGVQYLSCSEAARILGIKVTTLHNRLNSDLYPNCKRLVEKKVRTHGKTTGHPCFVAGVRYESIPKAAKADGIPTSTMRHRIRSDKFPDHYIVKE